MALARFGRKGRAAPERRHNLDRAIIHLDRNAQALIIAVDHGFQPLQRRAIAIGGDGSLSGALQLSQIGVNIVGVAIRDRPDELKGFLARNGNPFSRIGADNLSAIQFAIGSSGVPESFVIDGKGVIRYQHIGEIRPDQVPLILTKLQEAGQ